MCCKLASLSLGRSRCFRASRLFQQMPRRPLQTRADTHPRIKSPQGLDPSVIVWMEPARVIISPNPHRLYVLKPRARYRLGCKRLLRTPNSCSSLGIRTRTSFFTTSQLSGLLSVYIHHVQTQESLAFAVFHSFARDDLFYYLGFPS